LQVSRPSRRRSRLAKCRISGTLSGRALTRLPCGCRP
jgi:hypothetical protein